MRCRYTFPIRGNLSMPHAHPVTIRGWDFEFLSDGTRCTALQVTVPVPQDHALPTYAPPTSGKPARLDYVAPLFEELVARLRASFGLLAFFRPVELEVGLVETEYVPESDSERQSLQLFSIKTNPPSSSGKATSFRLVLQCLVAGEATQEFETALTFYRLGQLAFQERRYIPAFYNYYFVIESLFGNGRTSKKALLESYLAAPQLVAAAEECVNDASSTFSRAGHPWATNARDILSHFIDSRGALHHHSRRSTRPWHPDTHFSHQSDCICVADLTTRLLVNVAAQGMFTEETRSLIVKLCPHERPNYPLQPTTTRHPK